MHSIGCSNHLKSWKYALNDFYAKKEKVYPAHVSKLNSNREEEIILLMVPHGEWGHYLAVKNIISSINRNNFKV